MIDEDLKQLIPPPAVSASLPEMMQFVILGDELLQRMPPP